MIKDEQQRYKLHAQGYTAKEIANMLHYNISTIIAWHEKVGLACNGGTGRGGKRVNQHGRYSKRKSRI